MGLIFGISRKFSSQLIQKNREKQFLCPTVHSSSTLTIISFSISLFLLQSRFISRSSLSTGKNFTMQKCFHLEFSEWKNQTIQVENVMMVVLLLRLLFFQLQVAGVKLIIFQIFGRKKSTISFTLFSSFVGRWFSQLSQSTSSFEHVQRSSHWFKAPHITFNRNLSLNWCAIRKTG